MWQIVQIVQPFSVSFQKMSFQSFYSAFYGPKYKLMQILMIKSDKLCDSTFHNWTIQWLYVVTQVQLLRSSFVECCIYWNLNLIIQLLSLYYFLCIGIVRKRRSLSLWRNKIHNTFILYIFIVYLYHIWLVIILPVKK